MYTGVVTRYIIDEDSKNQILNICFHKGRTDGNGGHHDWLNRMGWGFGHYHYHHGLSAHLHTNGKCPHGELGASVINPYTDKKVELGIPYFYEDKPYFSLNLVSKALTANDNQGVDLIDKDTGGSFYACSIGSSSMNEELGEQLFFSYPRGILGIQNNTFFKTGNDGLELLCHNKKSEADNIDCYAYVSLEAIGGYMDKDGYFTNFSDGGSGVWSFAVRKPIVQLIVPETKKSFNMGDEIEVLAKIKHVASARLIVGKEYPMGYIDGFQELRYNLENQSTVTFSKFKITEDDIGSTAIENGSLDIRVSGHTGGTAIDAMIDARTLGDAVTIRIENSGEADDDLVEKSPEVFSNQYGELLKILAAENGYDVALVASVLYHESDGGTGFVDGKLFIRFEVHHFLSIDGGGTPGNSSQYANSSFYQKYFDLNTSSLWLGHKWRDTEDGEYTIVHPTGTKKDNTLQWQVFEFARNLNSNAAYNALGMGIPQIQGFNHNAIGFYSAEEMFRSFESGNEAQIQAFFEFASSDNKLSDAFKSKTQDNLTTIATIYNGGGNNDNYVQKISELYPLFESLK